MRNIVFIHDGGNIAAQFEIKEIGKTFFLYRSGSCISDSNSLEGAISKLEKTLNRCGLTPLPKGVA